MSSIISSPKSGSRTNSLGTAKTACHNCSEAEVHCDRQRPRCFTCIEGQTLCRGYVLDLSWQPGVASRGNMRGLRYPIAAASPLETTSGAVSPMGASGEKTPAKSKHRQFKFVPGKPVKRRKTAAHGSRMSFGRNDGLPKSSVLDTGISKSSKKVTSTAGTHIPDPKDSVMVSENAAFVCASNQPLVEDNGMTQTDLPFDSESVSIVCDDSDMYDELPLLNDGIIWQDTGYGVDPFLAYEDSNASSSPAESSSVVLIGRHQEANIPSGVLYGSLADKFHLILAQYDKEICVFPINSDCNLNPFRIRKESSNGSQFLLHAVLATSLYHITRLSDGVANHSLMETHRSTAYHMYSQALGDPLGSNQGVALLDTALILMCLDSAQNAMGTYNVHLEGIRTIVESAGGGDILIPKLPKLRAQLAMFIWYDTTISVVSRAPPTLPLSYLEGILRHGRQDGWDFFDLTGCREEFVISMLKLAKLAFQNEKAEEYEWLSFDCTPVDEVEDVLKEMTGTPPSSYESEDEETLHTAYDRHHCDEAWRNALLLYTARVFRWRRNKPPPGRVAYLARVVLNHVRMVRKSVTTQKELLLPVFLAGAELHSPEDRDYVKNYCRWWTSSCGFKMFDDVYDILGDIWDEHDNPSEPGIWWATIIERRRKGSRHVFDPQILMG